MDNFEEQLPSFDAAKRRLHTYKLLDVINYLYRRRNIAIYRGKFEEVEEINKLGNICSDMMMLYDYYKSLHWQDRTRSQLAFQPNCGSCGRPAEESHHPKYHGVLFREEIGTDLTSVCRNCHQTIHEYIDTVTGKEIIEFNEIKKVN